MNLTSELVREWKSQCNILSDWTKLLMLSSASGSKVCSSDIDELQDFGHQASIHKTPAKTPRLEHEILLFESQHDWKSWEKDVLFGESSLGLSGSKFSKTVEKQFNHLEMALNGMIKQVHLNNYDLSTSVRMLDFEKNNLKVEVGKGGISHP